jgi:hypothetical protein
MLPLPSRAVPHGTNQVVADAARDIALIAQSGT